MSTTDISKWGDDAMFQAKPILKVGDRVVPQVFLLSATPDPLGALAAGFLMYKGEPVMDLADITDDERRWAWEESIKGHLKAPWEFIDFQFIIEGVTRAFTHQLVRQRTAVYAQESLRFAVKEGFADEVAVPHSVRGSEASEKIWSKSVKQTEAAYESLVNMGIPAEDARGLLPHAVTTRVIYKTTLRGLLEHAGNRLCTQAQFEWRAVFMGIMRAIRHHRSSYPSIDPDTGVVHQNTSASWQWELIASPVPQTFAPICYRLGHCPWMGTLDRGCTIRERVNEGKFDEIDPMEWMANPWAGITSPDNPRPGEADGS
jgi:flavin-dependent thymidylate synthase